MVVSEVLFHLYLGSIDSSTVLSLCIEQQSLLSDAINACEGITLLNSLQKQWASNDDKYEGEGGGGGRRGGGVWGKTLLFSSYVIHQEYVKGINDIKQG